MYGKKDLSAFNIRKHLLILTKDACENNHRNASGDYHLDDGFLLLVLGWYPLTIMCQWSLMSYSGSETCGWPRQPNIMVPTRIRFFYNPSALCLALWAKNRIRLGAGNWCGDFLSIFSPSGSRSSKSTYNALTINYLLVFSLLQHFDLKKLKSNTYVYILLVHNC